MERAVWKSGSCDWLTSWANNLTSELQPQGRLQLFSPSPFPPSHPILLVRNGFPPLGSQPQPGSPEPCGSQVHPAREAWLRLAGCAAVYHPVHHPLQRVHRMSHIRLDQWHRIVAHMSSRLPPTTRHGLRLPPSACGSMPVPGQRLTRPTALRTSSSTLPSRFDAIVLNPHEAPLTTFLGHQQALAAPIGVGD